MSTQGLPGKFPVHRAGPVAGASSDVAAFTPYLAQSGATTVLRIRAGYLNALSVDTTGDGFDYSLGAPQLYWLHVTTDEDGEATAAVVERGGDVPEDSDTDGYQPLFAVDEAGVVTSQHVRGSLRHQMCGGAHLFGGLGG